LAKPMDEKLVQGSPSDLLEDHCVGELMSAITNKDVKAFRSAIEALVMNCFESEVSEHA
jgi:hypothetical protein